MIINLKYFPQDILCCHRMTNTYIGKHNNSEKRDLANVMWQDDCFLICLCLAAGNFNILSTTSFLLYKSKCQFFALFYTPLILDKCFVSILRKIETLNLMYHSVMNLSRCNKTKVILNLISYFFLILII